MKIFYNTKDPSTIAAPITRRLYWYCSRRILHAQQHQQQPFHLLLRLPQHRHNPRNCVYCYHNKSFVRYSGSESKNTDSSLSSTKHPINDQDSSVTNKTRSVTIPPPTWSIASLKLHESHEPVSMEELHILAKRSVLDMNRLSDTTKQQLCQDLGNMLHMIQNVQSFQQKHLDNDPTIAAIMQDPVQLYDVPRGVTDAPFRMDDDNDNNSTTAKEQEILESQSIRQSYLEPKMKRVGGHQYYEIITAVDT